MATGSDKGLQGVTRGRGGVSAVVLAAGSSMRMGQPKLLVPLAGRPILARTLDALRGTGVHEILVVLGADADRIRREVPMDDVRVILNPNAAKGMSTSIRAGVRGAASSSEAFLIVLGDQPLVASGTVDALLARWNATRARIVVPAYRGVRGNPVLLDRSLSKEIGSITGDVGCREVVQAHLAEVLAVPVDDPAVLIDLDTLEEVSRAEALLARGASLDEMAASRV